MARRRQKAPAPGRRADGTIKPGWYLDCRGRMQQARRSRPTARRRRAPAQLGLL